MTSETTRGVAYGLRQALDTAGAFVGPLLAVLLMIASGNHFRAVFWVATVPAFVAVAMVAFGVEEPKTNQSGRKTRPLLHLNDLGRLRQPYWMIVALAAALTLARFSQAFLLLRAQNVGLAVAFIPFVLMVMNLVYALSAYPAGALSDRMSRLTLLSVGTVFLVAADLVLAAANSVAALFIGAALWGLHLGSSEGLLSALVADNCPEDLRGTGFGVFNLLSSVALLLASVLAGFLWAVLGPGSTFIASAALAGVSLVAIAACAAGKKQQGFPA